MAEQTIGKYSMLGLIFVAIAVVVGEPLSGEVELPRLGRIQLPEGKWTVEHRYLPTRESKRPDCFVFRRLGDRLERIAIIRFRPEIAQKKASMHADSIADNIGKGIPHFIDQDLNAAVHDEIEQLGQPKDWDDNELELTYVYTGKKEAPWMSHSFISLRSDWIVIGVHSSPYAISPSTITKLRDESKILLPSD